MESTPGTGTPPSGFYLPVWDPDWLRASYRRCLWDGRPVREGSEFCSDACEEMYAQWEHDVTRRPFGREPVPGRHDEYVAVLPFRTPRKRRTQDI